MAWRSLLGLKPYYRNPRPEVLIRLLDAPVERALDVGCGAGAFGLSVRSQFGAELWGIEMEPEPASYAAERLDHVIVGDAREEIPKLPDAHFDLITFNDVLEHLDWPDKVLAAARPKLRPGGYVAASLPNLRYWWAFKKVLLDADFPQEDSGIFDRTHLRWYTKKSIPRLFESAGYRVEKLDGVNEHTSRGFRLLNLVTRNRFADARYLQFVIVARAV